MSKLSKQVAKVVQVAKNRTTKQVINDLMQMFCNLITEPAFIGVAFPNTLYRYCAGFRAELTYYKKDLPAWVELQELSTLFMHAIATSEPFTDHMGSLYDLELQGNNLGQFLTPPDLADLLGELALSGAKPITEPHRMGDDTGCGAGSLILGFTKAVLNSQGKGAVSMLDLTANDLDIDMVKIATVQIVMNSCIHRMPLHSLTVHNCNVISQYTEMEQAKHIAFQWAPNTDRGFYDLHKHQLQALKQVKQELEPA